MTNTEHAAAPGQAPGTPLQEVPPADDMDSGSMTDAYVQEFVLDHLDVSVKREQAEERAAQLAQLAQRRPQTIRLPSMAGAIVSMQQHQLQQQQQQSPPHQLLTPPGQHQEPIYHHMGIMPMQPMMPQHTGGVLVSAMKSTALVTYAQPDTTTPPNTPSPGRASPGLPPPQSPHYALDPEHPHIAQLRGSAGPPAAQGPGGPAGPAGLMDEMSWLGGPQMRQEPLDLRPNLSSDGMQQEIGGWGVPPPPTPHGHGPGHGPPGPAMHHHHGHTSVIAGGISPGLSPGLSPSKQGILRMHHQDYLHGPPQHVPPHAPPMHDDMSPMSPGPMSHHRSMSCSGSVISRPYQTPQPSHGGDDIISDDQLMTLTVRELNKRLHGYPRDEVVRLKQKRRTLKNRGYAQNCRSKRMLQRNQLEHNNHQLVERVRSLEMELKVVRQERDRLKERLEGASHGASPDYYPQ